MFNQIFDQSATVAQIVGLAKELDRIASETKSESPFEIAVETLKKGEGTEWSPALLAVLDAAKENCLAVYQKYISYTRTLPKTIPLVDKKPDRKMGLKYRPMVSDSDGTVKMYEAIPWFGGILEQPGETESIEDVRELLNHTSLVESVSWYFLYEATDALLRIKNCKLDIAGIVLQMIPEFYSLPTQLQKFVQLFEDQPVEKEKLILTIPAETIKGATKTTLKLIKRYSRNGIRFVLDGYRPEDFSVEVLKDLGITHLRPNPEIYVNSETVNVVQGLISDGFTFIGGEANDADVLSWLVACGFDCSSGTITGSLVDEDGLIYDSLARESELG